MPPSGGVGGNDAVALRCLGWGGRVDTSAVLEHSERPLPAGVASHRSSNGVDLEEPEYPVGRSPGARRTSLAIVLSAGSDPQRQRSWLGEKCSCNSTTNW